MKYGEVNLGQIEAAINKLGGMDGLNALLRDELDIRRKPSPFCTNEHGHYIITVIARYHHLTGQEEIAHVKAKGFKISTSARSILLSTGPDSYDAHHRLENGKVYTVAIVPRSQIKGHNGTTTTMQEYGKLCGYSEPLAGLSSLISKAISNETLEEIVGVKFIVTLHKPINNLFLMSPLNLEYWLSSYPANPEITWFNDVAFAFIVPEKSSDTVP
jgi:hypothetical protein